MRLIIEARLDDGAGVANSVIPLAVVERRDRGLSKLGLTLAEGRALLAEIQTALVAQQIEGWMAGERHCRRCGVALSVGERNSVPNAMANVSIVMRGTGMAAVEPALVRVAAVCIAIVSIHWPIPYCKVNPSLLEVQAIQERVMAIRSWLARLRNRVETLLLHA